MSAFIVNGGTRLKGTFSVTGNKNEALPCIAAALLSDRDVTLKNLPDIGDVHAMQDIATKLGARIEPGEEQCIRLNTPRIETTTLPIALSCSIRASVLFASALLIRTGRATISRPGGDAIGRRRLDTHFLALEAMGARCRASNRETEGAVSQRVYTLEAPKGLRGADVFLDEASVTATENAIIAAAGARGTTVITNAACEPHVQGLCHMLCGMGITIEGIGSNVVIIHGTDSFCEVTHTIGSDYIEAGSIIGLGAATRSRITVRNVDTSHLRMILMQFRRLGISIEENADDSMLCINQEQTPQIRSDMGQAIPRLDDAPWPGFPADLTSILLTTATQCSGTCLIHEKMFEARLFFVDRLQSMGAQVILCDPHRAVVSGPCRLYGSHITSPDIRAGMALLIAALAARGRSVIQNVQQIDRGYQRIDERLNRLGASIERVADRRRHTSLDS
jgi:UDP-N-acetylglucosamine 1-carboxyvinyltransferase